MFFRILIISPLGPRGQRICKALGGIKPASIGPYLTKHPGLIMSLISLQACIFVTLLMFRAISLTVSAVEVCCCVIRLTAKRTLKRYKACLFVLWNPLAGNLLLRSQEIT